MPGLSPESPWNQKALDIKYSPLAEDLTADVVVIGAGIAGLTCAYQLAKEGGWVGGWAGGWEGGWSSGWAAVAIS